VRWELLFADLEAQADAEEGRAFDAEVADLTRAEREALTLADRLRAHRGGALAGWLVSGDPVRGRLADLGADWLLLDDGTELVIPLAALEGVEGLGRSAAVATGRGGAPTLSSRVRIGTVLRRLARDRAALRIALRSGACLTGTLDRVAADHVDLALHATDELRRAAAVRGVRTVPLAALVWVRPAEL